jgi:hypothetical protein
MSNDFPELERRLLDSTDDTSLRALLESGRDELPNARQLDALALRLGPILGPSGGPTGGSGGGEGAAVATAAGAAKAAVAVPTIAKIVSVVGLSVAAIVGGTVVVRSTNAPAPPAPTVTAASVPSVVSPPPSIVSVPVMRASEPERAAPVPSPAKSVVVPPPVDSAKAIEKSADLEKPAVTAEPPKAERETEPETELRAMQRAQDALRSNPSEALAICNQSAQLFPRGMFGQERELIAIEALKNLGRTDEANRRAAQFTKAFPKSTGIRRLETLLGGKF